jgi:hypothetical protein
MPKARAIIQGLEILLKYKPEGYCEAQHDILYGPGSSDPEDYSPEDQKALEALGWHWDTEADCWAAFT